MGLLLDVGSLHFVLATSSGATRQATEVEVELLAIKSLGPKD
jgi:hypothetical protein